MKLKFLTWSFFILLSMSPHQVTSRPHHEDFEQPKPIMQGQVHGKNDTVGFYREGERRGYEGNHEIFHSIKGQKGKGAYGGANVVHPKHKEKGGASLSARASFFVTTTMLSVSLALILISPFLSL